MSIDQDAADRMIAAVQDHLSEYCQLYKDIVSVAVLPVVSGRWLHADEDLVFVLSLTSRVQQEGYTALAICYELEEELEFLLNLRVHVTMREELANVKQEKALVEARVIYDRH